MSGDNVRSRMLLGTGGSYATGNNHYSEVAISVTGNSNITHPDQTTSSMRLTSGGPDVGDSGSSQNGTITCYNFTHGNSRAMVYSVGCVNNTDSGGVGNNNIQLSTHCFEYTNGAVDRVKFFPDSGNITDGKIDLKLMRFSIIIGSAVLVGVIAAKLSEIIRWAVYLSIVLGITFFAGSLIWSSL